MIKNNYKYCALKLEKNPRKWLITGVAGFIGSNILQRLLELNQVVIGIDNFSTGFKENLIEVSNAVTSSQWKNFTLLELDIRNLESCKSAFDNVDYVLHHAALGSVPRSIKDPITTNQVNVDGFLNILAASHEAKIEKLIFASSSSVYGDHIQLPKIESTIGNPLSPYSVTKRVNEMYAEIYKKTYDLNYIGFRYFNVFGPRQNPTGPYAAVIPKWIDALKKNQAITINGDGSTSRDFCYVENVIQANILAACTNNKDAINKIYNIAGGERTTLNDLCLILKMSFEAIVKTSYASGVIHSEFREGDVKHSLASIELAKKLLHFDVAFCIKDGIEPTIRWFCK